MNPFGGLRVLDLGQYYQGPYAGLLLAMAGADVVKVEPPGGEPLRRRFGGTTSYPQALLNSNKRALELDLKNSRKLLRSHTTFKMYLASQAVFRRRTFKSVTITAYTRN